MAGLVQWYIMAPSTYERWWPFQLYQLDIESNSTMFASCGIYDVKAVGVKTIPGFINGTTAKMGIHNLNFIIENDSSRNSATVLGDSNEGNSEINIQILTSKNPEYIRGSSFGEPAIPHS